jgi:hypothetical protein
VLAVAVHMLRLLVMATMPGGHMAWRGPLAVKHCPATGRLLSAQALELTARQQPGRCRQGGLAAWHPGSTSWRACGRGPASYWVQQCQ